MNRFSHILYVTEDSSAPAAALERAVSLAENNQARLTVVGVAPAVTTVRGMPSGAPPPGSLQTAVVTERRARLDELIAPYKGRVDIGSEVLVGRPFLEVIRAVLRNGHDLVIKTAENPSWVGRLFGSDDMHLLRKCPCPVWLLRPDEKSDYQSIVAAVDFDPEDQDSITEGLNREILDLASSLALSDFATLHVAHAWDAPQAGFVRLWADDPDAAEMRVTEDEHARQRDAMNVLSQRLRARLGDGTYDYLSPRFHLLQGSPVKVLPGLVERLQADAMVMGTVARTGIPGLIIGNTAEGILDQLKCSVLAIKPKGFVTPVAQA